MKKTENIQEITAEEINVVNPSEEIALTVSLPVELVEKEIATLEQNCVTLAAKHKVSKVHVYVGLGANNERVVGYLKEPSYLQKIYAMDKMNSQGLFSSSEEMRSTLTLKEESDPRTYSEENDCDVFRLGMASTAMSIINVAANAFKKK